MKCLLKGSFKFSLSLLPPWLQYPSNSPAASWPSRLRLLVSQTPSPGPASWPGRLHLSVTRTPSPGPGPGSRHDSLWAMSWPKYWGRVFRRMSAHCDLFIARHSRIGPIYFKMIRRRTRVISAAAAAGPSRRRRGNLNFKYKFETSTHVWVCFLHDSAGPSRSWTVTVLDRHGPGPPRPLGQWRRSSGPGCGGRP